MNYFKLVLLFLLTKTNFIFAQEESLFGSSLWISSNNQTNFKKEKEEKSLFNFNPIIDFSANAISKKTKNIVESESSLFLVYQSTESEEKNLVLLQKGKSKTQITSTKIIAGDEILLNKGDAKTGFILSYFKSDTKFGSNKKGNLIFDDAVYQNKDNKNNLIEVIYIPRYINNGERNRIESYLSIKYGISLLEKEYYNSKGQKIWNLKENKEYKNRITGIGKDDFFGLNQKQSKNVENDGLCFAFNKLEYSNSTNKTELQDNSFLIWGDNNKSNVIKEDDTSVIKKMERIWKVQTTTNESTTLENTELVIDNQQIKFNLKQSDLRFWLVIDDSKNESIDFTTAKYIEASSKTNDKTIFNKINWKSNETALFTIVKAPAFFVAEQIIPINCARENNGVIQLKIVGGKAPYNIKIFSDNFRKEMVIDTDFLELKNLAAGSYNLLVSDQRNEYKNTFVIDSFAENPITLDKEYYLNDNNEIQIAPSVSNPTENIAYEWFLDNNLISSEKTINVNEIGHFKMKVTNVKGCSKEFDFEVKNKVLIKNEYWALFPNPVVSGQNFALQFHLQTPTNTYVVIYDLNGKIVKEHHLGEIKDFVLNDNILSAGTYLVTIYANGKKETTKLIIK